MYLIIFQ